MLKLLRFALLVLPLAAAQASASPATFYKDAMPILQQHCQSCHRPGEIGPMPLLTYEQTRPWAKAIRQSVSLRKMPPWFADPRFGKFSNDPSLTPAEIATIESWVDSGSPAGSKQDAPPPIDWHESGLTGANLTVGMPRPFKIPARATIGYQYIALRPGFAHDTWVRAVQIRPSDRGVVHHAVLYVREPGSKWLAGAPAGEMVQPPPNSPDTFTTADILAIYAPGAPYMICPEGMAKKIPAGSDLVLQLHYTSGKKDAQDQTAISMVASSVAPKSRLMTLQMTNSTFRLQPNESNQRVAVSGTLPQDALLIGLFPHMHLRGSGFEYQLDGGHGQIETLLKVNGYDFYWQLSYQLKTPRPLKAGTRLLWTGYFDNSSGNPRNPDPNAEVTWGDQSTAEMMVGFFDVAVPPDVDKKAFFIRQR
jgi:mono/diheme cytochrome c family protein